MNVYQITLGRWYDASRALLGVGYSGGGRGSVPSAVNNPDDTAARDIGPIPAGFYRIGSPEDTVTHGRYVLPLVPNEGNQMFGRTGF